MCRLSNYTRICAMMIPLMVPLTHWNCFNNGRMLIDESFIKVHRQNGQLLQIKDCTVHNFTTWFYSPKVRLMLLVCGGDSYLVEGGIGQFWLVTYPCNTMIHTKRIKTFAPFLGFPPTEQCYEFKKAFSFRMVYSTALPVKRGFN